MISAFIRGIKRRFNMVDTEEEIITNNKQKLNSNSNLSSTTSTTTTLPNEELSLNRPIKPIRSIIVPVERIEEEIIKAPNVEKEIEAPKEKIVEEEEEVEEVEEEVTPEANRTRGIDPFTLHTLKDMFNSGELDEVDQVDEVYPHNAELNDKVIIWRGDITKLSVDAIVNAANSSLLGGGGVDGAIHRAAGDGLYDECKPLDGARTGESKITGGHLLPSLKVIHTVGPIYSKSKREESERLLRSCYQTTLELAVANNCKTLAFSGISTGIYGYPIDDATRVALDVTRQFLETDEGKKLEKVIFTVFRQIDVNSYMFITPEYFPSKNVEVKVDSEEAKEGEEDDVVEKTEGLKLKE